MRVRIGAGWGLVMVGIRVCGDWCGWVLVRVWFVEGGDWLGSELGLVGMNYFEM